MRIVYFTHSLRLLLEPRQRAFPARRAARADRARPRRSRPTSRRAPGACENLLRDHGEAGPRRLPRRLSGPRRREPMRRDSSRGRRASTAPTSSSSTSGTSPALVAALGARTAGAARASRCCSTTPITGRSATPRRCARFDLSGYDGVLAFGETLAAVYRGWGWGDRVFVWHEAADTAPVPAAGRREASATGLVWIGNWGDGERSAELETLPVRARARRAGLPPRHLRRALSRGGARDAARATARAIAAGCRTPPRPALFARHLATVHVPRRFYVERAARHPDHPGLRGAGLRHPAGLRALGRREGLFRAGHGLPRWPATAPRWTRHLRALRDDAGLRARLVAQRARDHPRPPHLRATAPTSCSPSSQRLRRPPHRLETPHEDRLLRLEPAVLLLERRGDLLPRPAARPGRARPPASPSTSPTPSTGSSTATSSRRDWAEVVVYPATDEAVRARRGRGRRGRRGRQGERRRRVRRRAARRASSRAARPDAIRIFWDVDAPATLAEIARATRTTPLRRALPDLDLVLTYGGGPPVVAAYEGFGARALRADLQRARSRRPTTRCRRSRASRPTSPSWATACRTARRGWRRSSSTPRRACRSGAS